MQRPEGRSSCLASFISWVCALSICLFACLLLSPAAGAEGQWRQQQQQQQQLAGV